MLLTITASRSDVLDDATDLGFLLHKHPDKAQAFSTSYGTAHVLYPEADAERCTAALLLEVDPWRWSARQGQGPGGAPDRRSRSTSTTARTRRPRCSPSR